MLTPLFRKVLKVGVPFAAAFIGGTIYFSDAERQEKMALAFVDLREQIETRPEFMVNLLAIDGASDETAEDIREIFPIEFPVSSFDLELDDLQELIEGLPAVADASVRIRQGGILLAEVTERQPVALWRNRDGLGIVDIEGVVVGEVISRAERSDLPLVVGEGAERALPEALQVLHAARPLAGRVKGLVRMGERRWDVVLDRDQRIQLPAVGPVRALERVIVLNQVQDMLERDLVVVDMRLAERPTIRMNEAAIEEWWRVVKMSAEAE
ncbi:FtsQ-type POTRA domain-containing protein [Roseovarius faecimaris]|uniref:Cell division protein FtsQ n=2 Tax=Roseovarius faecimaris TaxID=2494550 RepID=A0A6I6J6C7_9RHOB|nr:FtsQ-type POTRA domain-containing protein [Roseovarius faecimaris]